MTPERIDEIERLLRTDEVRNVSVLNFLRANALLSVQRAGNSILVRGRSDHVWNYVSSDSPDELAELASRLTEDDDHFAAIEEWMVPTLCRGREMTWCLTMRRFALPDDVRLPEPGGEVDVLSSADADRIYEHSIYRSFISAEYTRSCILNGPSVAIRDGGQLVAWAMTQDDGAMGFLQVLEAHQRKGYARRLTIALAGEIRRRGSRPFAYVAEDNLKAISLLSGLGFSRDRTVQWFQTRGRAQSTPQRRDGLAASGETHR